MSGNGIGDAPATIPVALLPVRLETRYVGGDLLVRIYPDRWHQFSHQEALTQDEAAAGIAFWAVTGDRLPYWTALCARFSTPRATWIIRATNPAGPAPDTSRTMSWDIPVTARGLPDQWVAAGYAAGNPSPVVVVPGSNITDGLAIGPTPGKPPAQASEDGAGLQADEGAELQTDEDAVSRADEGEGADEDEGQPPDYVDAGMAWLADFNQALKAGMALQIQAPPPLDRLVVVGITASADGTAGAQMLTTLLAGHKYTDGMSLLPQGTATNASRPADPQDAEVSMATAASAIPAADPASDGARLCAALGVDSSVLADIDGAPGHENMDAQAANAAFWHAGWGHLLASMLGAPLTEPQRDAAWLQFTSFVRARGPLAAVRLGDQPFGVLPVLPMDLGMEVPGEDPHITALGKMLAGLQPAWMAAGARRLQDDVTNRVKRTPRPRSYYGRGAWQPAATASLSGWFKNITHFMGLPRDQIIDLGDPAGPQSADKLALTQVQDTASLLGQAVTWAAPRVLLPGAPAPAGPATALLIAGQGAVLRSVPPDDILAAQVAWLLTASAASLRADLTGLSGPDSLFRILIRFSLLRALELGGGAVPAPIPAMPLRGRLDGQPDPAPDPLGEAYSALQALSPLTSGQLDLLLAESLELTTTGWHAWATSLATRRLALSRAAGGSGIILGGYGVVDAPAPGAGAASQGFVQAPSLAQATTAAILHSAQLTHSDGSNSPLSPMTVDLTSRRVRRGQGLLDGVRAGQPIGALLGYQLERDLQTDHGDYIAPFRALAPLDPPASTDDPRAIVAVATDVTDGLALSRLRHGTSGIPWNTTVGGYPLGPEIPDVTSALDDIDETLDAASDILLAESVHSALNGSPGHAAATLDTGSQGTLLPPPPRFIRTQRTGIDITHRIICLAPDAGEDTWPQTASTADAPALAAWLTTVLGSPDATDVALQPTDPVTGTDLPADPVIVPLTVLGLGPLDLLRLSGQPGELTSYLRWRAVRNPDQITGLPAGATVRPLLSGAPAPVSGHRTLGAVLAAAQAAATVLGQARGMDGRDLNLPGSTDPAADLSELANRVSAARARLHNLAAALPAATADTLQQVWLAGIPGAVSAAPDSAKEIAALAPAIAEQIAARLAKAAAVPDPGADAPAAAQLAALSATMQALRGDQLPVLATLNPPQPGIGQLAVQATDASAADPGQAPAAWFARIARASEPAAALETMCACSEVLGTACPLEIQVGQLPLPDQQATQPWIGLPLAEQTPAGRAALTPRVSLAFIGQPPQAAPARLAGLVVDEWAETIPSTAETAGLSFHYNAPRAQAPQAVLVVTPTGLPEPSWALDDLAGAVNRAMDLAQARLAERADLPATPLLPAVYLDGTGPDATSPADGIPAGRLAPMAAGIADQDGAPVLSQVTGTLTQGATGQLALSGSNLGSSYAFDTPRLTIAHVSNTQTTATLQVQVAPDAPGTVHLTATTSLGQSPSVAVTINPQPRLTASSIQPLAQAETTTHVPIAVNAQGIISATDPIISDANGNRHGLSAAITGIGNAGLTSTNATVYLTVTVPGSPRPSTDWDPGKPGSSLKPPPPPVSSHQQIPLILTITAGTAALSTAGLSPGLTLNALVWTEEF